MQASMRTVQPITSRTAYEPDAHGLRMSVPDADVGTSSWCLEDWNLEAVPDAAGTITLCARPNGVLSVRQATGPDLSMLKSMASWRGPTKPARRLDAIQRWAPGLRFPKAGRRRIHSVAPGSAGECAAAR